MSRSLFEYHPVFGYRFIPGIHTRVRHESGGYLVKSNQAGFRCRHEVTQSPKEGVFRIVLFGDSFTAGDGVSNKYRYGDVLESRFEEVEILNFGLPGTGTDQQYLAFREFARDLDYDLMIIAPFVENIERIIATHRKTISSSDGRMVERAKPYFTLNGKGLKLHHQPVPKDAREVDLPEDYWRYTDNPLKHRVRKLYDKFPNLGRAVKRARNIRYPMEYENPLDPAWLLMKAILTEWTSASRSDVIICPIPAFPHIDKAFSADQIQARFRELNALEHVEVADIFPRYWKMSAEERHGLVYHSDEHPSRRGHEVIAEALEPTVRKYHDRWKEKQ